MQRPTVGSWVYTRGPVQLAARLRPPSPFLFGDARPGLPSLENRMSIMVGTSAAAPHRADVADAYDAATEIVGNFHRIVQLAERSAQVSGDRIRSLQNQTKINLSLVDRALDGPIASWASDQHVEPVRRNGFAGESWIHMASVLGRALLKSLAQIDLADCRIVDLAFEGQPSFEGTDSIIRGLSREAKMVGRIATLDAKPPVEPDGPIYGTNSLRFRGEVLELRCEPKQWKLLVAIWNREVIELQDVCAALGLSRSTPYNDLKYHVSKLSTAMLDAGERAKSSIRVEWSKVRGQDSIQRKVHWE
jgi:hypothetical protein